MMTLKILTPESSLTVETDAVFLPGSVGEFEVLQDHAPLISSLSRGSIRYRDAEGEHCLEIQSGFVDVRDNVILACVER